VEHARGCDEFPTSSAAADRGFWFEEIRNESSAFARWFVTRAEVHGPTLTTTISHTRVLPCLT